MQKHNCSSATDELPNEKFNCQAPSLFVIPPLYEDDMCGKNKVDFSKIKHLESQYRMLHEMLQSYMVRCSLNSERTRAAIETSSFLLKKFATKRTK